MVRCGDFLIGLIGEESKSHLNKYDAADGKIYFEIDDNIQQGGTSCWLVVRKPGNEQYKGMIQVRIAVDDKDAGCMECNGDEKCPQIVGEDYHFKSFELKLGNFDKACGAASRQQPVGTIQLRVFQIISRSDEESTPKKDFIPLSSITLYYGTKDTLVNLGVIPGVDVQETKEINGESSDDDSLQTEDSALNSLVLVSRADLSKDFESESLVVVSDAGGDDFASDDDDDDDSLVFL